MADVFISYATEDAPIAQQIYRSLTSIGVDTFLAQISIKAGSLWTKAIFDALRSSEWVIFIASKASCASHAVQQELGASLISKKTIVPVLIDISPSELPGWVGQHQAIDARTDAEQLNHAIQAIGKRVKDKQFLAGLVLAGVVIAVLTARDR